LPQNDGAWIEVDTPTQAIDWIRRLQSDAAERARWAARASAFYDRHLDADRIHADMRRVYGEIAA
jgi:hypothetical protein